MIVIESENKIQTTKIGSSTNFEIKSVRVSIFWGYDVWMRTKYN